MAIKIPVKDQAGKEISEAELSAAVFEAPVNVGLMHQAYVRQMANARLGTHNVKTRSMVNRTKAKWYRQKGTGRARHGSRNAPIFVGGGVAHGPQARSYKKNMPKKMRRAALRSALTVKAQESEIILVESLEVESGKTRDAAEMIYNLAGDSKTLILLAEANENLQRALKNLPDARWLRANYLNIRDLLTHDRVIIPMDALEMITDWLAPADKE